MENLIKISLVLHVGAGALSLISGLFAIFFKKGSKRHMMAGRVYFWSMAAVVLASFVPSIYRHNYFMLAVGIFSLYMAYTGYKLMWSNRVGVKGILFWADRIFLALAIAVTLWMIVFSLISILNTGVGMNVVLLVFGVILAIMAGNDLLSIIRHKEIVLKPRHILGHIARMGGAYIATVTAFLVVNVKVEPAFIIWLIPTAIGSPLIARASFLWAKKLKIQ